MKWTKSEVSRMIMMKNLEYIVIGKISYGWPRCSMLFSRW